MKDFRGKIAVITGAGSGIGRSLTLELVRQGAHVAICDIFEDSLAETELACRELAAPGTQITVQRCDVSDEAQVVAFRDLVEQRHGVPYINLLISNAGIAGGGSFIHSTREQWERTFNVCWNGVYYCARAFLPMLIASSEGCIVNVSSVNGFFAVNAGQPHSAYSTAKFAVKGFSESLYTDLRCNAPHVKVALVMPGHIGTSIVPNSMRSFGLREPKTVPSNELGFVREWLAGFGVAVDGMSDDAVRELGQKRLDAFRDTAPMSPAEAAHVILEGVRNERWRILVGNDARRLDEMVRSNPDDLYDPAYLARVTAALQEEKRKTLAKRDSVPA